MPDDTTSAPANKGEAPSDKPNDSDSLSNLKTQLAKHRAYHERVKAINAALRKARINTYDDDAEARGREVLMAVLGDELLVTMYLPQLMRFSRGERTVQFPSSVLVKNGQTINAIERRMAELSRN